MILQKYSRFKILKACVISGICLGAPNAFAAENPPLPLIEGCTTCHGAGGKGAGSIPAISGLREGFFIAKMTAFQTDTSGDGIMTRFATGLTAQEIAALAAWFEKEPQ